MEGLIPLVYRAIMQHKIGGQGAFLRSLLNESPSASYVRLPGDSGRFQASEIPMFRPDRGFSTCTSPSSCTKRVASGGVQSPGCCCNKPLITERGTRGFYAVSVNS
ncbi:hypothetical protein RJ639_031927 [Escallonia herrerae]|uniref:Uncharacterized protein n=1 Tax=Escallonia herrerae TaxID=1293975 RepID=A0AA88X5T9_9ASTE|nr:hypothetical protein RJ639_031927 [Escallonia herrerae]